ncbi:hypothetical protein DPMN_021505 [Dreissena polymorpha]|uniref:Uncharacterized protein n=1 Tax=Dreissena polymorpha TaxID=45954 RepID=A0A9D4SBT6_DREPO|nr:hypothetical protein DPMN_021505 [Dreissena polymorpha]
MDSRLCSSNETCINGCRFGYVGTHCNVTCPETCSEVTSGSRCSDDVSCSAGCIDRYSGKLCEYLINADSSAAYTSGNTAVIAGSIVGGVCFIPGCVIITLLLMKKRYMSVFIYSSISNIYYSDIIVYIVLPELRVTHESCLNGCNINSKKLVKMVKCLLLMSS